MSNYGYYGYETVDFTSTSPSRTDKVKEHRVLVAEDQPNGAQLATGQVIAGKSVGAYDPRAMPWDVYEELLRYQLEVRCITNEKAKKLAVITEIGPKAYMELKNALAGKALKDVETADELLGLLQKRFSPKKLLIAERHRMMLLGQEAGQGLAEFYSHIQEAADTCDFPTQEVREMMVLQVFVKGMRSEGIRATLLQKERLKPEEALELAQVVEMAEVEAHGMADGSGFGQLGVHRVSKPKSRGVYQRGAKGNSRGCKHCGNTDHDPENCRFRQETCHYCKKKGHIKKVCLSRPAESAEDDESGNSGRKKGKGKQYRAQAVEYQGSQESVYGALAVRVSEDPPQIEKLGVELNGHVVYFDLDSGAYISLMDQKAWSMIGKPKLQAASNCRVTGWGGIPIDLLGKCAVRAKLEGLEGTTTVYVTKKTFKPLLGKNTVRDLNMDMGPFYRYASNSVVSQVATAKKRR